MKKRKYIILSMILIMLITGGLFEQKGRIKGNVKDKDDKPIQGAKVKPEPTADLPEVTEVETDADGDYITEDLLNGLYLLNVTKAGYIAKQKDIDLNFSLFSNGEGFNCSSNINMDVTLESEAEQQEEAEADPNLVHYWNFNENTGSSLYDVVGGITGTITGATWTTGKSGYALDFDPGADTPTRYVDFGTQDLSSLTNATIELWFTFNEVEPECYNWLFTYYQSNSKYVTIYFVDKYQDVSICSKLSCYITPTSYVARSEITTWVPGVWHHLAITLGDSGMRLYVDGVLSTYVESNSIFQCFDDIGAPTKFYLSKSHGNVTPPQEDNCIRGKLDEIRIYNKAKTAAEILADYNTQK